MNQEEIEIRHKDAINFALDYEIKKLYVDGWDPVLIGKKLKRILGAEVDLLEIERRLTRLDEEGYLKGFTRTERIS